MTQSAVVECAADKECSRGYDTTPHRNPLGRPKTAKKNHPLLAGFQAKSTNSRAKEIQLAFLLAAGCWLLGVGC
jgi:hypothetical protein